MITSMRRVSSVPGIGGCATRDAQIRGNNAPNVTVRHHAEGQGNQTRARDTGRTDLPVNLTGSSRLGVPDGEKRPPRSKPSVENRPTALGAGVEA